MTHVLAHIIIFMGYVGFAVLIPDVIGRLMYISKITLVAGAGFFLTCGITHIGLTIGASDYIILSIVDHLQAGFVIAFGLSLLKDFNEAVRRIDFITNKINEEDNAAAIIAVREIRKALSNT